MTKIIQANCNECGGERNAFVRASHRIQGQEDDPEIPPFDWVDTLRILECCGCNALSAQREFMYGDWDNLEITYWPPKQSRKPDWHNRLPDDNLRQAMQEVYVASNQGLVMLASIGLRTLLDRSFFLLLGEDHGNFPNKLAVMVKEGFLPENDKRIFQSIANVGNAAAHQAHVPSQENFIKILRAVESFLYQRFILPDDVKAVEKDTPSRGF